MTVVPSKAKYRRHKPYGPHKSNHNDSGHKHSDRLKRENGLTKSALRELAEEKIRARRAQKTMVLLPSGKRRMEQ